MMSLRYRLCVPWVLVGLTVVASAAWAVSADQIGARIRNRMNCLWQVSNLKILVTPYQRDAGLDQGCVKRLDVTATSVVIDGVKMTGVKLAADDIVLDLGRLMHNNQVVFKRKRSDTIRCRVSESDLNKALTYKKNTIQNLHVKLGDGLLTFTGTYKFGLGANLMLQGRLAIQQGYLLNFVPTRASVNGVPLPTGVLKIVLSKVNPLIDFHKVPLQPSIDRIIVDTGYVTVVG